MITKKVGDLEYLAAEGISAPHGFTTRFGGVSQGHLASLNIGIHRRDAWENVLENYRILGRGLGFDVENWCFPTRPIRTSSAVWMRPIAVRGCLGRSFPSAMP